MISSTVSVADEVLLIVDAELALRLEPQNQEIKKQYAEAKSLFDKVYTIPCN